MIGNAPIGSSAIAYAGAREGLHELTGPVPRHLPPARDATRPNQAQTAHPSARNNHKEIVL